MILWRSPLLILLAILYSTPQKTTIEQDAAPREGERFYFLKNPETQSEESGRRWNPPRLLHCARTQERGMKLHDKKKIYIYIIYQVETASRR